MNREGPNGTACRLEIIGAIEVLGEAMEKPEQAEDLLSQAIARLKGARRHAPWWVHELRPKAQAETTTRRIA